MKTPEITRSTSYVSDFFFKIFWSHNQNNKCNANAQKSHTNRKYGMTIQKLPRTFPKKALRRPYKLIRIRTNVFIILVVNSCSLFKVPVQIIRPIYQLCEVKLIFKLLKRCKREINYIR